MVVVGASPTKVLVFARGRWSWRWAAFDATVSLSKFGNALLQLTKEDQLMPIEENRAITDGGKSMSEKERTDPRGDDLRAAYEQLCTSYHAIDDFRAKLLGLLPLATGTGILLLFNDLSDRTKGFLGPIGVFGIAITFGLFSYEIYGIKKCARLIAAGRRIESSLDIDDGQFKNRPQDVAGLINKPFAAGVIYPTVLAAWTYLALVFALPKAAPWTAILVFVVFFACTLIYDSLLRKEHANNQEEHTREEIS